MNILISTTTFGKVTSQPIELLNENGFQIITNQKGRKLQADELINHAQDVRGIIAGTEKYDRNTLQNLPNLKVISRLGIGMDNIDTDCANELDIQLFRTQTTPAKAVAELALGMIIDISRKISNDSLNMKNNLWKKELGELISNKTLGVIGLGNIGKTLIKLTRGFNFKLLAYDINKDESFAKQYGVKYCNLHELLSEADIISVHLNSSEENHNLLGKFEFSLLKKTAIFINTSRGEVVDEKALYQCLKEKKILGAGIDVYKNEPYKGDLQKLDNIILTPHIGSYAKQIRNQMEIESVENLVKGLSNV